MDRGWRTVLVDSMDKPGVQLFGFLLICLACLLPGLSSAGVENALFEADIEVHSSTSSASMFVFGASMVDSGTNAIAMPYRSGAEFYPYGSDYFEKPVGRWSNGRTFMDILTQSLGFGFLDPFIRSVGSNYTYGVNFASSGATAQNTSSTCSDSGGLFSLLLQVEQFREYQQDALSRQQGSRNKAKLRKQFSNSIYFVEIAHNDYLEAGLKSDQLQVVNLVIASMRQAFEVMYMLGARNFIVMNVTPLGCTPSLLSLTMDLEKDEYNCTREWNDFVNLHNKNLEELLDEMRSEYSMAEWILFDAYSIFLDGYQNASKYGILYPFEACCGAGGPYNHNSEARCGGSGTYINGTYIKAEKCEDPTLHLIWDSIHPIESFSKYIAQGVLYGTHLYPMFNIRTKFHNSKLQ